MAIRATQSVTRRMKRKDGAANYTVSSGQSTSVTYNADTQTQTTTEREYRIITEKK